MSSQEIFVSKIDYNLDVVMCIDASGSMATFLEDLKAKALSFYQNLADKVAKQEECLLCLRVKVIAFRDYMFDEEPMVESEFFTLPEQNGGFKRFVDGIHATGGGDEPENALEAIALALKSSWATEGGRRRHVILVFSDSHALQLGERAGCPNYPAGLPKDIDQLEAWWEGRESFGGTYKARCGRLLLFVPDVDPWTEFTEWDRCWLNFPHDDNELQDFDIQNVVYMITNSF